jgi:3-carboxy-cis,cis-muconate cycloisomerase
MPTSAIDSAVFRHIFGTEQMCKVWSDENRTQRYLDIEAALARAQANLGVIPAKAAAEITKQARVE